MQSLSLAKSAMKRKREQYFINDTGVDNVIFNQFNLLITENKKLTSHDYVRYTV